MLKLHHGKAYFLWTEKCMQTDAECMLNACNLKQIDLWLNVFFSDERQINFSNPDGWAYYWDNLQWEPHKFFSWQQGEGLSHDDGCIMFYLRNRYCFSQWSTGLWRYQNVLKDILEGETGNYNRTICQFIPLTQQQFGLRRIK